MAFSKPGAEDATDEVLEEHLLGELAQEKPDAQHMAAMLAGAVQRRRKSDQRRRQATRLTFATVTTTMVVIMLLVVPVSYVVNVGNRVEVTWPVAMVGSEAVAATLADMADLAGQKIRYQNGVASATLVFVGSRADEAESAVRTALAPFLSEQGLLSIASTTIQRKIGGNALAALSHGYVRVFARGMSDDEVEAALIEELGLIGIRGIEAEITNLPDGSKNIEVQMQESPHDSITFEVTF